MGIAEKIAEIEFEMSRTQKNKATEHHLGGLKAKLAKLRAQLLEPATKGPKGEGFDVMKCFVRDTQLYSFDGPLIRVQDIRVGDTLLGPDSTKKTVIQRHTGQAELFLVTPKSMTIRQRAPLANDDGTPRDSNINTIPTAPAKCADEKAFKDSAMLFDSFTVNINHVLVLMLANTYVATHVRSDPPEQSMQTHYFTVKIYDYDPLQQMVCAHDSEEIPIITTEKESDLSNALELASRTYTAQHRNHECTPNKTFTMTIKDYLSLPLAFKQALRQPIATHLLFNEPSSSLYPNPISIPAPPCSSSTNEQLDSLEKKHLMPISLGDCFVVLGELFYIVLQFTLGKHDQFTFTSGLNSFSSYYKDLFVSHFLSTKKIEMENIFTGWESVTPAFFKATLCIPSFLLYGSLNQIRKPFIQFFAKQLSLDGPALNELPKIESLKLKLLELELPSIGQSLIFLARSSGFVPTLMADGFLKLHKIHSNDEYGLEFSVNPLNMTDSLYGFTLNTENKCVVLHDLTVSHNSGDARVAMIGFPSVGKSTLLSKCTKTESATASYEFTTLTCIPGVIEYKGSEIQLLDLPGIIEGAADGKGRGKQVIAVSRTADMVLMVLDASKGQVQREKLERELYAVGIRLNCEKPNIHFREKKVGGVHFTTTVPLTKLDEKMVQRILASNKIFNADVVFRGDYSDDEFIDVIMGNTLYMRCLYVYNKIDCITIEEVDRLAREPNSMVISCEWDLNLDRLIDRIWNDLALVRVFTKKRSEYPDFEQGLVLRNGSTVEHACHAIHRNLSSDFRYALVWGQSVKFSPMRVGLNHRLESDDVLQIVKQSQK